MPNVMLSGQQIPILELDAGQIFIDGQYMYKVEEIVTNSSDEIVIVRVRKVGVYRPGTTTQSSLFFLTTGMVENWNPYAGVVILRE